jgi:hypothetical protein
VGLRLVIIILCGIVVGVTTVYSYSDSNTCTPTPAPPPQASGFCFPTVIYYDNFPVSFWIDILLGYILAINYWDLNYAEGKDIE